METMNAWRRGAIFGGAGFGSRSLMGAALSQAQPVQTDWMARGRTAVSRWNALVERISNLKDDMERGRLLQWMGRSDVPGSNTERYGAVVQDLREGAAADPALAERRVGQLEGAVEELRNLVENAERTYGTISDLGLEQRSERMDPKIVSAAILAAIALLVAPFIIGD
jgi:hypothetical protein